MIHWFSHSWIRKSVTIEYFQLQNQPGHCTDCHLYIYIVCIWVFKSVGMSFHFIFVYFLIFSLLKFTTTSFKKRKNKNENKVQNTNNNKIDALPKNQAILCSFVMRNCLLFSEYYFLGVAASKIIDTYFNKSNCTIKFMNCRQWNRFIHIIINDNNKMTCPNGINFVYYCWINYNSIDNAPIDVVLSSRWNVFHFFPFLSFRSSSLDWMKTAKIC